LSAVACTSAVHSRGLRRLRGCRRLRNRKQEGSCCRSRDRKLQAVVVHCQADHRARESVSLRFRGSHPNNSAIKTLLSRHGSGTQGMGAVVQSRRNHPWAPQLEVGTSSSKGKSEREAVRSQTPLIPATKSDASDSSNASALGRMNTVSTSVLLLRKLRRGPPSSVRHCSTLLASQATPVVTNTRALRGSFGICLGLGWKCARWSSAFLRHE
jgi:hypothetical protein